MSPFLSVGRSRVRQFRRRIVVQHFVRRDPVRDALPYLGVQYVVHQLQLSLPAVGPQPPLPGQSCSACVHVDAHRFGTLPCLRASRETKNGYSFRAWRVPAAWCHSGANTALCRYAFPAAGPPWPLPDWDSASVIREPTAVGTSSAPPSIPRLRRAATQAGLPVAGPE